MMIPLFFTLNILVLLSGLLGFREKTGERNFTLTLIQTLLALPLLACEYLYLSYHWQPEVINCILFSEVVFVIILFSLALRIGQATQLSVDVFRLHFLLEVLLGAALLTIGWRIQEYYSIIITSDTKLSLPMYGPLYFFNFLTLAAALYSAWRLEQFWHHLSNSRRWEYKFLVVGCLLICGALAWSSSYRITYLTILPKHFRLLSALLFFGWAMICYAVMHHRLLNRKFFVSRKIVYSFIIPSFLTIYLLGFGLISLLMRTFGLEMSFILKWLLIVSGVVAVSLFAFSRKIRRRVHFFISTHFYVNKYEYRDEWLALSQQLEGALSEAEVIKGLREVLAKSLYTDEIFIWLFTESTSPEYKLLSSPNNRELENQKTSIAEGDSLVQYLKTHPLYDSFDKEPDHTWFEIQNDQAKLFNSLNLALVTPIAISNQLTGIIGLGPEFTGGKYGIDDFDLLAALGCQTASTLLSVRMAEELARIREQQAWNQLSAFVLHDIKNASTMLSLLQENAPKHIHEPEFQQDMLELVDDTLKRMGRVEQRLGALKDGITPSLINIVLGEFLHDFTRKIKRKLPAIEVTIENAIEIPIKSDPELLASVLENLLLNAIEAKGEGTVVRIRASMGKDADYFVLEIIDNGPGIKSELLPDLLFQPFKTNKKRGSGIGLWQVKNVLTSLGSTITAGNCPKSGAEFKIRLPLA